MADYPAAIQHRDLIGTNPLDHNIGTGAYRFADYQVGISARLERNPDHSYWGDAYLDDVTFVDLGTDPAAWFAAAEAGVKYQGRLDVMLARRKMTSRDLARQVGITEQNLSLLKSGRVKGIRFETLARICAALDCQPGDLLEAVPEGDPVLRPRDAA